jgi:hypothetical protein
MPKILNSYFKSDFDGDLIKKLPILAVALKYDAVSRVIISVDSSFTDDHFCSSKWNLFEILTQ